MPGTLNLEKSRTVQDAIDFCAKNGKYIAAICAAPSVIGKKGLLKGKKATCFPGNEPKLKGAELVKEGAQIIFLPSQKVNEFRTERMAFRMRNTKYSSIRKISRSF